MAKKKKTTSQSAAIREHLTEHPTASTSDVVSQLGFQGIKVRPDQVYTVRSQMKKARLRNGAAGKKVGKNARKGAAHQPAPKGAQTSATAATTAALFEARAFIDRLGGFAEARNAIDTLEKLQG